MNDLFARTDQEFVVYINRHLQRNMYVSLGLALVLGIVFYALYQWNPGFFSWTASPVFWVVYGLYLAAIALFAAINRDKKIVFSARDQEVFSQTALGKKTAGVPRHWGHRAVRHVPDYSLTV